MGRGWLVGNWVELGLGRPSNARYRPVASCSRTGPAMCRFGRKCGRCIDAVDMWHSVASIPLVVDGSSHGVATAWRLIFLLEVW